jgi:ribosomal protein S18 acetylase RimI-like enzyme
MGNDATRLRQAYASEDGWFLAGLGVVPECQRQGYGTSLLRPVLRRLDEQGLDCYLDTQKQANLDYYRRFGFEVIATMEDPKYKITTWGMRRPPQVATD